MGSYEYSEDGNTFYINALDMGSYEYSEDGITFYTIALDEVVAWNNANYPFDVVSEVRVNGPYLCKGEKSLWLRAAATEAPYGWPFEGRSAQCRKYWKRQEKNRKNRERRAAKREAKKCPCCGK